MTYKPITVAAELPPAGQPFPENLHCDIKGQVPSPVLQGAAPVDQACDIAAFANANGGVILVGAHENPRGTLSAYVSMTQNEASKVVGVYQQARDLCSPRPIIDPLPIERSPGQWVVAVNVDAYAAPPIGVQQDKSNAKWWAFPARRGDENRNLYPEELATIMDPVFRRKLLRLLAIPIPSGATYPLTTLLFSNGEWKKCNLIEVDREKGLAHFEEVQPAAGGGGAQPVQLFIPIDCMLTFWVDHSDNLNRIRIDGRLHWEGGLLHFWPVVAL